MSNDASILDNPVSVSDEPSTSATMANSHDVVSNDASILDNPVAVSGVPSTSATMDNSHAIMHTRPGASFAEIAATQDDSGGFQEVYGRKSVKAQRQQNHPSSRAARTQPTPRSDVIRGTDQGIGSSLLRGVRSKPRLQSRGGVFVSRLSPSTSVNNLQDYVLNKAKLRVKCFQLKSRHDSYKSFRIIVSDEHRDRLLVPTIWPQHVVVRQFFDK